MKVKTIITIMLISITLLCLYIFNNSFRKYVNIYIAPHSYHWYETNATEELPLPPKTTLNFRSSTTDAQYVTKLSFDHIKEFYSSVSSQINYDETKKIVNFNYNGSDIFISFTKGYIYNVLDVSLTQETDNSGLELD